jgi:hypothetical protein
MQREFHVFFLSDRTAAAGMPGASARNCRRRHSPPLGLFAQVLTVDEMIAKIREPA